MNIISLYLGGCLIGGGIAGVLLAVSRRKEGAEPAPESEAPGGYLLEGYEAPEREEGAGVYGLLLSAFRSLQEQKAGGYRSWIPACIEKCQKGYFVPSDVALLALRRTREELTGSRFDLSGLDKVIAELKEYQL